MNLSDMIAAYREEAHDIASPPFMSDTRLAQLATEAQNEACRRAGLIRDSISSFCAASITAGDPMVELDDRIIDVLRVRTSTQSYPLSITWSTSLDSTRPGWEVEIGDPTAYLTDYQTGYIRLYPTPTKDADLLMTVSRLPLNALEGDSDEPEIRKDYHPALVQWMLYKAYAKQDVDLFDPRKSSLALAEFEKEFGRKVSARNETWQRERNTISAEPVA